MQNFIGEDNAVLGPSYGWENIMCLQVCAKSGEIFVVKNSVLSTACYNFFILPTS